MRWEEQQRSPYVSVRLLRFLHGQAVNSYAVTIVWEAWAGYFTSLGLSFFIGVAHVSSAGGVFEAWFVAVSTLLYQRVVSARKRVALLLVLRECCPCSDLPAGLSLTADL